MVHLSRDMNFSNEFSVKFVTPIIWSLTSLQTL
jgi:hypothetical protein